MQEDKLDRAIEAIVISAEKSLSVSKIAAYFDIDDLVNTKDIRESLKRIQVLYEGRGFHLAETANGFRFQTHSDYQSWVTKHWIEKPPRYSRALLETLALIIYRQPITRAEIEDIRGVAVSSNIVKTLQERDWIRIVGHKEVPGKPSLLGTTSALLDYFNLKSLDEMPTLNEIQDIDKLFPELVETKDEDEDSNENIDENSSEDENSIQLKDEETEQEDEADFDDEEE